MTEAPELEEFERQIRALTRHPLLRSLIRKGEVRFGELDLNAVSKLSRTEAGYYFLIAAASLNRTTVKAAMNEADAKIVAKAHRRAFAIRKRLPVRGAFEQIAHTAVALRRGDLARRTKGAIEQLFRERLRAEGIPVLMSPPVRQVPGLLIGRRKPDGVFPDPATNAPPRLYLEIKNVRRVRDDIQKRLYEIAEASLEMKLLYGTLELKGWGIPNTTEVASQCSSLRARLRKQIVASPPVVVLLLLCSRTEAERYRDAAEAFVDRVFFQEEIEDCLAFLKRATSGA
jgi:hypothetical protein